MILRLSYMFHAKFCTDFENFFCGWRIQFRWFFLYMEKEENSAVCVKFRKGENAILQCLYFKRYVPIWRALKLRVEPVQNGFQMSCWWRELREYNVQYRRYLVMVLTFVTNERQRLNSERLSCKLNVKWCFFLEYLVYVTKTKIFGWFRCQQSPINRWWKRIKVRYTLTHVVCPSVVYRLPLNKWARTETES